MIINIDSRALKAFLDAFEDAEAVGEDEYVADLYDVSEPVSLDLAKEKDGWNALAARRLMYDDEQDGWYLSEEIDDAAEIAALLHEAMDG